jgi:hypothetical protein
MIVIATRILSIGVQITGRCRIGWERRSRHHGCNGWQQHSVRGFLARVVRKKRSISRRGKRYLRALFVQAAWLVLVKLGASQWERYGLKSWIETAKKRLHHNVPAIALANKLARIAWAVLKKGRVFTCVKTDAMASRPA